MSVFGRTYADQKAHEIKLYGLDKEEKKRKCLISPKDLLL